MSTRDPRLILHELTDLHIGDGYNGQPDADFLKHVLAGYRDYLINGNIEPTSELSRAAARSWQMGIELARADQPHFAIFAEDRPSEFGTEEGVTMTTGVAAAGTETPDVLMARALVKNMDKVIGTEVGQFLYHGTTCAEVVQKDGMRLKLVGIGWVWMRHTRLKP